MVDLGSTVSGRSSRANSVNGDGTRIIGWQDSDFGNREGVYWENGEQHYLKDNAGNTLGEAGGISADGKTITGSSIEQVGFIWNEEEGTILYNPNAGEEFPEEYFTTVAAISDDGNTAVGFSFNPFMEGILQGSSFIWTKANGFQNLNEFVDELGFDNLGIDFSVADAISPDGKYIGGIGVNWDIQDARGFLIKLPDTMGTNDEMTSESVLAYPNPVKDVLNLQSQSEITKVEIFNLVGQKIASQKLSSNQMDVSHLAKGVYVFKVHTQREMKTIRIIKD